MHDINVLFTFALSVSYSILANVNGLHDNNILNQYIIKINDTNKYEPNVSSKFAAPNTSHDNIFIAVSNKQNAVLSPLLSFSAVCLFPSLSPSYIKTASSSLSLSPRAKSFSLS